MMQDVGIIIGHFEPLHLGHVRTILHASGQVKDLYIFITPHPAPNPNFSIDLKDKARWMTMAFADLPFVHIEILPDLVTPSYEDNYQDLSVNEVNAILADLQQRYPKLSASTDTAGTVAPVVFMDETHPFVDYDLHLPVVTTPRQHGFFNYFLLT